MNGLIPVLLGVVGFLLCTGGFVGAFVALAYWSAREQKKFHAAAAATGFGPVTQLDPELAGRLLALAQDDVLSARVVCPYARREAGWTVLLQGIEGNDGGPLATWQLTPAIHAPGLAIPRLTLLPRSEVGHRFTGWIGRALTWRSGGVLRPVAFPYDARFDGLFQVLAVDEDAVRRFLDERRRAALAERAGCLVVGEGDLFTFDRFRKPGGRHTEEIRLAASVAEGYALLSILWG